MNVHVHVSTWAQDGATRPGVSTEPKAAAPQAAAQNPAIMPFVCALQFDPTLDAVLGAVGPHTHVAICDWHWQNIGKTVVCKALIGPSMYPHAGFQHYKREFWLRFGMQCSQKGDVFCCRCQQIAELNEVQLEHYDTLWTETPNFHGPVIYIPPTDLPPGVQLALQAPPGVAPLPQAKPAPKPAPKWAPKQAAKPPPPVYQPNPVYQRDSPTSPTNSRSLSGGSGSEFIEVDAAREAQTVNPVGDALAGLAATVARIETKLGELESSVVRIERKFEGLDAFVARIEKKFFKTQTPGCTLAGFTLAQPSDAQEPAMDTSTALPTPGAQPSNLPGAGSAAMELSDAAPEGIQ